MVSHLDLPVVADRSSLESHRNVSTSWLADCGATAKQHWGHCCGRRGWSHHTSSAGLHLCSIGLCARVVTMGTGAWHTQCSWCGDHSWGLMLPTSTRTPGVNYTSSVAARYPPLNREVNGQWIVGTHSSGGLDGLVGRYQLVIWKKPSKEFMCAREADLSSVIEPLLHDVMDIHRVKAMTRDVRAKWRQRSVTNWFHLSRTSAN